MLDNVQAEKASGAQVCTRPADVTGDPCLPDMLLGPRLFLLTLY